MLNNITIQGRLTKDIELRYTKTDKAVASFTIACNRSYGEETDFINCIAWQKTAEFIQKYFNKGDMLLLSGRLQQRTYEDKDGKKRSAFDVVVNEINFCESKKSSEPEYTGPAPLVDLDGDEKDLPF